MFLLNFYNFINYCFQFSKLNSAEQLKNHEIYTRTNIQGQTGRLCHIKQFMCLIPWCPISRVEKIIINHKTRRLIFEQRIVYKGKKYNQVPDGTDVFHVKN